MLSEIVTCISPVTAEMQNHRPYYSSRSHVTKTNKKCIINELIRVIKTDSCHKISNMKQLSKF